MLCILCFDTVAHAEPQPTATPTPETRASEEKFNDSKETVSKEGSLFGDDARGHIEQPALFVTPKPK